MKRLCILCLLGACVLPTTSLASPAPDGVGSDCSWSENGEEMIIGDTIFKCLCARLTGPNGPEILCRWHATKKAEKRRKVTARKTVKPLVVLVVKPAVTR